MISHFSRRSFFYFINSFLSNAIKDTIIFYILSIWRLRIQNVVELINVHIDKYIIFNFKIADDAIYFFFFSSIHSLIECQHKIVI